MVRWLSRSELRIWGPARARTRAPSSPKSSASESTTSKSRSATRNSAPQIPRVVRRPRHQLLLPSKMLRSKRACCWRNALRLCLGMRNRRRSSSRVANVSANGKSVAWKQAAASLPAAGITAHGEWRADLQARGVHGVCFAEVEVDVETGHVKPIKMVHVQDCGLPLNRLAMESQINGGMIQSLGMALWEGRVMDAQLGMQLNPGLGDYKIPGSLEMPEMVPLIDDEDKREAVIGMSEGCIIPAVGALVNAVFNATGLRVRELPITPDKILMGLMNATKVSTAE